jgi:serine protease Do
VLRVGRVNQITEDVVRTDCSLVGGDSGGPLIAMDGSVVGIHSKIGRLLRENFHVPSNEFLNNWTALLEPVVLDRQAELSIKLRGESNVIDSVTRRSLADRSGLKVSDRIIRIGEKEIYDKLQFDDAISNLKPYQEVEFEVRRKGKNKILNVVLGEKSLLRGIR